ncbi:putative uncharacterized protein DDB_G0286901 [Anopheles nili]|uniref:putative uncharacterized protein DDB_G0286901 n=1 Tax=Anopheles nili TaxID=185578 RepID=UPI00237B9982|nr:putative uncharacterized protein DDB_G0286901 [Anopheles nili]
MILIKYVGREITLNDSDQFAIKVANKCNEKRLSSILELTTVMVQDDKPPKIIDATSSMLSENKLCSLPTLNKNNNNINNSDNHSKNIVVNSSIPAGIAVSGVVANTNGGDWSLMTSGRHQLHNLTQNHALRLGVIGSDTSDRTPNGDSSTIISSTPIANSISNLRTVKTSNNSSNINIGVDRIITARGVGSSGTVDVELISTNGVTVGGIKHHNSSSLHNNGMHKHHLQHLHPNSHHHHLQQHQPHQQKMYVSPQHQVHQNHHVVSNGSVTAGAGVNDGMCSVNTNSNNNANNNNSLNGNQELTSIVPGNNSNTSAVVVYNGNTIRSSSSSSNSSISSSSSSSSSSSCSSGSSNSNNKNNNVSCNISTGSKCTISAGNNMNRNICSVTSSDSGIIINSSGNTHTSSPLKIASASIAAIIANGSAIAQVKSSSELNMSNGDIVSSAIKTNGISHSTSNNNSIVNPDITLTLGSGLNVQNPNLHQLHQLHHHHQQPQQNHHLQQLAQLQHHPHHQHNHNLSSVHIY